MAQRLNLACRPTGSDLQSWRALAMFWQQGALPVAGQQGETAVAAAGSEALACLRLEMDCFSPLLEQIADLSELPRCVIGMPRQFE